MLFLPEEQWAEPGNFPKNNAFPEIGNLRIEQYIKLSLKKKIVLRPVKYAGQKEVQYYIYIF